MSAINKNFVIKNGLEVDTNLILADAYTNKVGIGTTVPQHLLHVNGGIGATNLYVTGIGTFPNELNVGLGGTILTVLGIGGSVGVGTANPAYLLDVRSPVSTGQTALYVKGDVYIDGNLDINFGTVGGDLEVDNAIIANLTATNINSAGISTLATLDPGTIRDINNVFGTSGQYLKSTGTGIEWESFGVYRNQQTFISTEGQTNYNFIHQPNEVDVYLNGAKLIPTTDFVGIGSTVTLIAPAFAGDLVEMISLVNSGDLIIISGASIDIQDDGTNVGLGTILNFGSGLSVIGPGLGAVGVRTVNVALSGIYDIGISGTATYAGYATTAGIATYATNAGIATFATFAGFSTNAGISTNVIVTSSSTSNVVFPTFVTGIGSTSINVNTSKLSFIPSTAKLGIGTTNPQRNLEVVGDIAVSNQIYATSIKTDVLTGIGTLNSATPSSIGIDTSGLVVGYIIRETAGANDININTVITSIGINSIAISPNHTLLVGIGSTNLTFSSPLQISPGKLNQVLVSRGSTESTVWLDAASFVNVSVVETNSNNTFYPIFSPVTSGVSTLSVNSSSLSFNPATNSLGIGTTSPSTELEVVGDITAIEYFGSGANLSGIVTQITAGIGIDLTPTTGKGSVEVQSYRPVGKTIYVSQTGNDDNTGLAENHTKRTVKSAAMIAFPGDTVKVFPGVYVEENPIVLARSVAVEGTELRNCIVTPKYLDRDLFYVNNGCHVTDLSFIGPDMSNGSAIVSLQPLLGVSTDRFFDATRLIRLNLDYIANEAVGYITSTEYRNPPLVLGISSISGRKNDITDMYKSICFDITRGGNSKCVGAGKSYYTSQGVLQNIVGIKTEAIDALRYSFDIARAIVNNSTWGSNPVGLGTAVVTASYNANTGITTITAVNHGLSINDAVRVVGLGFTCPSGPGTVIYPTGSYGYVFNVRNVVGVNTFEVVVGQSTLPHTYVSGGTVQKYVNFQNTFTQVKDLGIQNDPITGHNNAVNGCSNVISAIYTCVGIVTTIINNGLGALGGVGIKTTYPGNLGIGFTTIIGVSTASYDNETGNMTLSVPGLSVKPGDVLEVYDLNFSCNSGSGISTQTFPSGVYGYEFYVNKLNANGSFIINTGVSTISHTYINGGFVVNRSIGISTAKYNNISGITTITANGAYVKVGDVVTLIGLGFTSSAGPGIVTFPSGNLGYNFPVTQVIGSGTTFVVNIGVSTLAHTYVSGGIVKPAYSRGVGPIIQGPYIRNCTNFVGKSIGLKVDGFNAEPGNQDDIGVTGSMSVDSYTQYNQGGIGVSVTNSAYAQLVSIFTICNDIAIYTASGGQCDINNSNASFGNYGLYSEGVGDYETKSIYRYTGVTLTDALEKTNLMSVSGVGSNRPYDGQSCYFGTLYYFIDTIDVTNGGSGYTTPPRVTISTPTGPNGITAQASSTITNGSVTSINIVNSGSQYINSAVTVTIAPPTSGIDTATASVSNYQPIYYRVNTATLPSAGISTISFLQTLNNTVSAGTTVYFARASLQLATTIGFEYVGSGTNINTAKPALGGVVITENQVVQLDGGSVTYTSTDQGGNFRIGDGVTINQSTGQISGRDFTKALFTTMTPFILALSD